MNRIVNLTQNLAVVAVSLLLCLLAVPTQEITFASTQDDGIPQWVWNKPVWQPCQYEDSNNCVWNAKRQGIGGGTSYVATSKGRVIYIHHWQAYRLSHSNHAP